MNRLAFAVLTFLFAVPSSFAQIGFSGADAAPKATIEGSLHKRSGDEVEGTIVATIAEGWHVNSQHADPRSSRSRPCSSSIRPRRS